MAGKLVTDDVALPEGFGLQLGAGALAVVLLKEVFSFLRFWNGRENGHVGNGDTGHKPPDFWRQEIRVAQREVIEMMILPILEKQTEILDRMNDKITEIGAVQRQRRND